LLSRETKENTKNFKRDMKKRYNEEATPLTISKNGGDFP
jgi:hypothetical protein